VIAAKAVIAAKIVIMAKIVIAAKVVIADSDPQSMTLNSWMPGRGPV